MITRAHIRRQLRKEGGIMNAVPRQGYFLGGIGDAIGDVLGKAGKVVKQVVKSPVGKAALLGGLGYLANTGTFGVGPQNFMKNKFAPFFLGTKGTPGVPDQIQAGYLECI